MAASWRAGVPVDAVALYGRWWQLETWLRSLAYVELRARHGLQWARELSSTAEDREAKDRRHPYMATPDAQARLAYLDVFRLFEVLESDWDIFTKALIEREVWSGRVIELQKIRNRIGHCRRPHADDLTRLEQTLRDLEPGAFGAVAAFNRTYVPDKRLRDPLVRAWVIEQHEDAARLVDHANRQYDTRFVLRYSKRPWSTLRKKTDVISGVEGYIWHATWVLASSYLNLRDFWADSYLDNHRDLIMFVCSNDPVSVEVSFAALDDPSAVADAIGNCFDALILNSHRGEVPDRLWRRWAEVNVDLDPRVQVVTPWSVIDDTTTPVTIFGA